MYNGNVGGISGGNQNVQWSRQLAEELDAADGKKDGKISANNWNVFLTKMGSKGNKISNYITVDNAVRSFNFYESKKDAGKVDWNNWEEKYNEAKSDFKEGGIRESMPAQKNTGTRKTGNQQNSSYTPVVGDKSRYHKGYTITSINENGTFWERADENPTHYNLCNASGTVISSYITDADGNTIKRTDYKNGKASATYNYDKDGNSTSARFHQYGQTAKFKVLPNGKKVQVTTFDNGDVKYTIQNPKTGAYDVPCDQNGNAITQN